MTALRVLVSAPVATAPGHGGLTWVALNHLLGWLALGHDAHLVEQVPADAIQPPGASLVLSDNVRYLGRVAGRFGIDDRVHAFVPETGETVGGDLADLAALARNADVLVNASGALTEPDLLGAVGTRVYLDLDPGFTQLWHAEGIDMGLEAHTHFATVAVAFRRPGCPVPNDGRSWIGMLPPVALDQWPPATALGRDAFTTVANWRGYGSIEHAGRLFGQKAHALRPLFALPVGSGEQFQLALAIHDDERDDVAALDRHGWQRVDPAAVAATPEAYRGFVRGSRAEFGLAKTGYVACGCGWFSDRSACYLAAGRPVVALDTGFSDHLPTGEGLLTFSTLDQARAATEALRSDYHRHARAARRIAEEHFDAARVLTRLLDQVGR